MSSISVTQKSKTLSILDNRNVSLIILSALVTLLVAVVAVSASAPAARSFDYNAYMLHRQGEWASVPVRNAQAYQLYRQGEWNSVSVPAADLGAYHLSERTLVDAKAALLQYLLSERTFIDPMAGLATYYTSERTSVPVSFTKFQLSEWFGK